ncbi:universal stress protein [Actinomyces sp. F1_1611]
MDQTEIVVGVDGSRESLDAALWAGEHAKRVNGHLTVVCAYPTASYSAAALDGGFAVVDDESLHQGALDAANEAAAAVREQVGVDPEVSALVGDPSIVLAELSKECDLIVIGSRGGGGFADRLLGAVSSAVPAHSKCPVVTVPPHRSGKPFTPIERIVVGVDGSDQASTALVKAVDLAFAWQAELTAVVAIPVATAGGAMAWLPVAVDRQVLLDDIMESLNSAIEKALNGRDMWVARHVLDGSPAALLTEFSTAVDLVVVGTRGRGGFAGMLLGSTSQTVLHHSTCPVMTVPSRHRDRRPSPTQSWERR